MAYDGLMMARITKELKTNIIGGRINKLYQISKYELLLLIRSNKQNYKLIISIHPMYARVQLTSLDYPTPTNPNPFTMLYRKHLEGAFIKDIKQYQLDRLIKFTILTTNEVKDPIELNLFIEIMGKHSNVTLTYPDNKIIDSLKRISPAMNTNRFLQPGATYELPPLDSKTNPFTNYQGHKDDLLKHYQGFSPLIANEITYRLNNNQEFNTILNDILTSNYIYLTNYENKEYFSLIELTHLKGTFSKYSIFDGLDQHFNRIDEKERIKQQTSNLLKFINDEFIKNTKKLIKLKNTLLDSKQADIYRVKGDLLFSNLHLLEKGMSKVILDNYYDNTKITIDLDPKIDGKSNAKKYYNKYQKAKNSLSILQEQIDLTSQEITYFDGLQTLINDASYYDALEIKEELENQRYLKKHTNKQKRKPNKIPGFRRFITKDNIEIAIGKNNIQNDYISFKYANKQDIWFHVKDMPGSHVLVKNPNPDEYTIRLAATIAAYYSKGKNSSSVPVNYAPAKTIKKPSGAKPGLVVLSNYKTIYIDPNDSFLSEIEEIK